MVRYTTSGGGDTGRNVVSWLPLNSEGSYVCGGDVSYLSNVWWRDGYGVQLLKLTSVGNVRDSASSVSTRGMR